MYKAIVIGLGNIGMLYDLEAQRPHPSTHVLAYEMSPDFELVCGVDGDHSKETVLHTFSPRAFFFESLDNAIESGLLNDIDVVSICTPPNTHLEIIMQIMQSKIGKIIFCEKPIVRDRVEAEQLMKVAETSDIIIIPNISRRWNSGLRRVTELLNSGDYGELEKINIRYTRGIYNTGSHLFDLLRMWTESSINKVFALSETMTSALPEKTVSFWFELDNEVTGYAEAINDNHYYQFDIDLFCSEGKIEMRNSGDDIICYETSPHHLFQGFKELKIRSGQTGQLNDACIKNAIDNISNVLKKKDKPNCELFDAIYPLRVAEAIEKSLQTGSYVEVEK